jgi:PAS domain S-box-containing protein
MNPRSGFPDTARPAARAWRHAARIGVLAAAWWALGWPSFASAQASAALEAWRARAAEVRTLAENDAPAAYEAAHRLGSTLPPDVQPTDRVRLLNLLGRIEIQLALTELAIVHTNEAFELAQQIGDKIGQAEADLNTALSSVNEGRIDRLVTATTRSLTELEGTTRHDLLGEALLRTSTMYRRIGQVDDSVTMAMQAMEIARRANDPLALTYAHQGLAISFDQSFRTREALEHSKRMREQARLAHSRTLEAYAMVGIGNLTAALGDSASGEKTVREAIAMFRETGAPYSVAYGLTQLATNLRGQHRYREALATADEALEIYELHPNRIGMWYTLNARSMDYEVLKQIGLAKADVLRAYELAKQINFPLYISESAQRMAKLAAAEGDFHQAYMLTVEANEMTARAARERASARMVELAQRYESESKQREIIELTQRNRQQQADLQQAQLRQRLLWTVLGAALVVFAGTVYFLVRLRRSQTELRRSEGVLRVREQEFRALVEHSPDLVARYDDQCRRTYVNPALARALGMEPDALVGTKPVSLADMPPEQGALYEARLRGVLASGEQGWIDVVIGERSIQVRLVAEHGADGRVASVLAIGRDVTEMMETQRQLTTLLDNLPDMVARFDRQGRYLYVNPAVTRVSGLPAEHFRGKTASEAGLDRDGVLHDAVMEVIRKKQANVVEVPWKQADATRYYEVRHLPERDERGEVGTVLGIAREVTERKRIEQLVRELGFRRETAREEERKYIARELHDELGQLLSALRFEVSVIRMRFGPAEPAIAERAATVLALVDSVIRLQRNLVSSLRPAVLDMGIGAALEWLVGEFSERSGIACTLDMSESQIRLDADQTTMVFRIVQESLTNVARHAQASRVRVMLTRDGAAYCVSVSDDGKGFDARRERDPKSLGLLGLQDRAQMLNGRLEVRSARGAGTTIAVTFPASADAATARLEAVGES